MLSLVCFSFTRLTMSNPTQQQSRLSLQLRKRNLERTEDGLPQTKHAKQNEITDLTTQKQKIAPAFGAPPIEEERKVTAKRSNPLETTTTQDNAPKKKRVTRQSKLQQFLSIQSPVSEASSQKQDSAEGALETTLSASSETTTQVSAEKTINIEQQQQQQQQEHQEEEEKCVSTTVKEDQPSLGPLNSPSASPTVEPSSNADEPESTTSVHELDSLPSPTSTPKNDRTKSISTSTSTAEGSYGESQSTSPQSCTTTAAAPSSIVHGKSLLIKLDKERINEERTTLDKLVSALDITLTFHAARNVAAFFHKIQPMLRNSTKKNVTISHLCQILHVAPELYDVETKLLKEYGKDVEAHQVSIGQEWKMPLSGKMIQERKDLMMKRSGDYYEQHQEANARIPEKELPRLDKVVDKKKWLQNANLPDRVRSVLELQEQRKAAKEAKAAQPRVEPVGSAKDRAKALLERIRNKQKK
ncbi:hypothetical protein [Absidia glauca]|uniref:CDT1 Geminin-binding domain-containing protein n=1 Tax=Absidia glauca TaxID=4829 RepID=A0A163J2B5_ABSGL|nr:hypothetical protein [Absidia glauca]